MAGSGSCPFREGNLSESLAESFDCFKAGEEFPSKAAGLQSNALDSFPRPPPECAGVDFGAVAPFQLGGGFGEGKESFFEDHGLRGSARLRAWITPGLVVV